MPENPFISSLSPLRPQPKHGTPLATAATALALLSLLWKRRSSKFLLILSKLSLELYCPLQSPRDCCKHRTLWTTRLYLDHLKPFLPAKWKECLQWWLKHWRTMAFYSLSAQLCILWFAFSFANSLWWLSVILHQGVHKWGTSGT